MPAKFKPIILSPSSSSEVIIKTKTPAKKKVIISSESEEPVKTPTNKKVIISSESEKPVEKPVKTAAKKKIVVSSESEEPVIIKTTKKKVVVSSESEEPVIIKTTKKKVVVSSESEEIKAKPKPKPKYSSSESEEIKAKLKTSKKKSQSKSTKKKSKPKYSSSESEVIKSKPKPRYSSSESEEIKPGPKPKPNKKNSSSEYEYVPKYKPGTSPFSSPDFDTKPEPKKKYVQRCLYFFGGIQCYGNRLPNELYCILHIKPPPKTQQCAAFDVMTGHRCTREPRDDSKYCFLHYQEYDIKAKKRCTYYNGNICLMDAQQGSNYCEFHNWVIKEQEAKKNGTDNWDSNILIFRYSYLLPNKKQTIENALKHFNVKKAGLTVAEVSSKFRKEAAKYHPDKGGDPEKFKKINGYKDALIEFLEDRKKLGST
jgi:hypothetical protein